MKNQSNRQKITAAVVEKEGKILIAQRKEGDRFGGLWEFPGGKIKPGETPEECLKRELFEEFGIEARVGNFICSSAYDSPTLSFELLAYHVTHIAGKITLHSHQEVRWVKPSELNNFMYATADIKVVETLKRLYLSGKSNGQERCSS